MEMLQLKLETKTKSLKERKRRIRGEKIKTRDGAGGRIETEKIRTRKTRRTKERRIERRSEREKEVSNIILKIYLRSSRKTILKKCEHFIIYKNKR